MSRPLSRLTIAAACSMLVAMASAPAVAADIAAIPIAPTTATPAAETWDIFVTPYGWLSGLKGNQMIRGRSSHIDASFIDIAKESDTLVALMSNVEARRGPFALYADLVWTWIGINGNNIRVRSLAPGVTTSVGQTLSLTTQMMIIEAGAAYEVGRHGAMGFDLLGGARYWYQQGDLSYDASIHTDIGDLERVGSRAFARSGSVQWLDPLIGGRLRYSLSPRQEVFLRADAGGFGIGSKISWQAIGGYSFNLGSYSGAHFSGIIGYRALSVSYARGYGARRYEYDMLQYGPAVGLNIRF